MDTDQHPVPIAYIYVTLATGGAERHLLDILSCLDRERFEPHVICFSEAGAIGEQIKAAGVPFRAFGLPRKRLWLPGGLLRVAGYLRRHEVRIVHTHMYHANTYGRLASLLAGVPHRIATIHTTGGHPRLKQRIMNRLLNRSTDRVVVVSEVARRALLAEGGLHENDTIMIHNGVDTSRFRKGASKAMVRQMLGVAPGDLVVTVVARLEPEKRHHDLLRAFHDVREDLRNVHLLVVGGGSMAGVLAHEVRELGLEDHVTMTGQREDVPDILNASDLFVLPSSREGAPMSVLEAMAAGVPVVASAVGGVPELVGDDAGITYPSGDVGALTSAMRECLRNTSRRVIMGDAAQERVAAQFSADRMVQHLQAVYAQVLATPRTPASA